MSATVVTNSSDQFLKLQDVAERLRVSVRSVRREIARGRLAKPVKVGVASRWPASDVQAYMERLKQERGL